MNILVTGAKGFIGRNLCARLRVRPQCNVRSFDIENSAAELREWVTTADVVFHLAGVNRPRHTEEYETGNAGFTETLCDVLRQLGRTPKIVMASSVQAELDNPYGLSKRHAEQRLEAYARQTGAEVRIYRLKNVFGKWCRPNYNSVVATFCHNVANDLPISVSDPSREIELVYVDDVVDAFGAELSGGNGPVPNLPTHTITLGELAGRIQAFHGMHTSLLTPDFSVRFNQQLYATYLSYTPNERRRQQLDIRADARGELAEVIKSTHFGQIFVSRTKPGVTRGNHYHHTKCEKFLVVQGNAIIRMRHNEGTEIIEYRVSGENFQVIDIPPGIAHSIENVGFGDMVTLFWASEVFDPDRTDTHPMSVLAPMAVSER
jgi:UDP-2-acetamido-2,6-beta-L-arabino-hexul-4-ose reductase